MGKTRNTSNISAENIISVDVVNDRIGITSTSPGYTLDVGWDINFSGTLYQAGVEFTSGVGGGGSGTFDTGITTSIHVSVTSGVGINTFKQMIFLLVLALHIHFHQHQVKSM